MNKQIKKIIPYFLILIILVGLFSPILELHAQIQPTATFGQSTPAPAATATTPQTFDGNALSENVPSCWNLLRFDMGKCLVSISYFVFYTIPSSLLGLSGIFFNAVMAMALSSVMYTAPFISSGWVVVRDLSNIFFILILLYIAIKVILGMGGHDVKKMIVQVIVMALLINFSMFFTKVVIDTSNILALVFYNKINVETQQNSSPRAYSRIWSPVSRMVEDRDISGGIYFSFDPTKLMTQEFFDRAKQKTQNVSFLGATAYIGGGAAVGGPVGAIVGGAAYAGKAIFASSEEVPDSLILTIIIVSGLLMAFAAYAFFVAGMSFVARLIELWVLIIFSPFAFVSSAIPLLSKIDYVGWDAWTHRLLKTSFMAPIFMFFIYLIFLFVQIPLLRSLSIAGAEQDTYQVMVLIILQALITLVLLMKATKYAKESSGKLGEILVGGAKMAAGLAIGVAASGGAAIVRGTVGAIMKGATTGETAANRMAGNRTLLASSAGKIEKFKAAIDLGKGHFQTLTGINYIQQKLGPKLQTDQHNVEHSAHARHDLDSAAEDVAHGKKWKELNNEQREMVKTNLARKHALRDKGFGNKTWSQITDAEKLTLTGEISAPGNKYVAGVNQMVSDSKQKQGLISTVAQAAITGSYDPRNIANIIAKEQTTGLAKMAMGMTGILAKGMRGGFKLMGVNYGEGQKEFFKDLGHTISESLKSVKINVDLSHVGEVKKEDKHGGGGGHH